MPADYTGPIRRINRGRGHSYVDANGAKVPGVTTILSGGVPKPALVNWAANTTIAYAVDHWDELSDLAVSERIKRLEKARFADRDTAANRGTRVHALAVPLAAGEEVDVPDELVGHVESYARFLDDFHVTPRLSEYVVMSHRYGYAGTADLQADLLTSPPGGSAETWLLDIKTSRSGVFGETALQLAAYRYADVYVGADGQEHPVPPVARTGVVHVRADGYELVPVIAEQRQHRDFLYVQQVHRFCESASDLVCAPVEPPRVREVA